MKPIMSIIIPIYNAEQYIIKCFDSIRNQKVKEEIEIICIDDGSTDRSRMICDKYAKLDKRFKVFHKKNGGVSSARNLGLSVAKGKYIAWIDPDDYIADNWWDSIKFCLNLDVDILFFDYTIKRKNEFIRKSYSNKSGYIKKEEFLKEINRDNKIQNQLWSKIFKREIMKNIYFPETVSVMEDYAVLHKIVLNAKKIYYLSKTIYFYILRENSLVNKKRDSMNFIKEKFYAYKIKKERYNFLKKYNYDVEKIEYLIQALIVCICYYKIYNKEKNNEFIMKRIIKIFNICKREIKKNIMYILRNREMSIIFKIKFLLFNIGVLKHFFIFRESIRKYKDF